MNLPELFAERAQLLQKLGRINSAIELQKDGAFPVKIRTLKNLRNSSYSLAGVEVYEDEELTQVALESDHGGYICKASLAHLHVEVGDEEDHGWWVEEC